MTEHEEKRLLAELKALPDYQGWTFVYVYPGYFSYSRGPYSVFFTPDWDEEGKLSIQVQDDEGHSYTLYASELPLPHAGRTGRKLFDMVRPTLDKISKVSRQHAAKRGAKSPAQLDAEIAEARLRRRAEDSTWRSFSDSLTPDEYRTLTSFGKTAYGFWYDSQRKRASTP